jgi:hypothetical protein
MTRAGEYALTDKTYAYLLGKLADHNFEETTPALRANILTFYGDPAAPFATKRDAAAWQKTQDELQKLKDHAQTESAPAKAMPTSLDQ